MAGSGRAFVSKNWEAPKVKNKHAKREPSKPDFNGFLPNGRHVVFEAKAILKKSKSFPFSRIAKHQWEHLSDAHQSSAVSFIYLLNGDEKWVFPWAQILRDTGIRKSIPLTNDYGIFKKRIGETWLDTWVRLDEQGWT